MLLCPHALITVILNKFALGAVARLLTKTKRREHSTLVLVSFHWLPLVFRIKYNIIVITSQALHCKAHESISESLCPYRNLCYKCQLNWHCNKSPQDPFIFPCFFLTCNFCILHYFICLCCNIIELLLLCLFDAFCLSSSLCHLFWKVLWCLGIVRLKESSDFHFILPVKLLKWIFLYQQWIKLLFIMWKWSPVAANSYRIITQLQFLSALRSVTASLSSLFWFYSVQLLFWFSFSALVNLLSSCSRQPFSVKKAPINDDPMLSAQHQTADRKLVTSWWPQGSI